MTDRLLELISARFPLTETGAGEFAAMKIGAMRFNVRKFDAEGLGAVSVMKANGMAGLMRMDTLIVTPLCRDLPLFSCDGVNAMSRRTVICELYDTLVGCCDLSALERVKASANGLPAYDTGSHWYDGIRLPVSLALRGGGKYNGEFERVTLEYAAAYIDCAGSADSCSPEEKRKRTAVYVDGLLSHGGPSTDVFKKALGDETTARLFRTVLFSTVT